MNSAQIAIALWLQIMAECDKAGITDPADRRAVYEGAMRYYVHYLRS